MTPPPQTLPDEEPRPTGSVDEGEIEDAELEEDDELSDDRLEAEAKDDGDDEGSAASEKKVAALAKANSSQLDRRDPLAVYMRDAQRYPLLTREEEHELAVKYFEDGDTDAARKLVTSNLRLVVKIAYDYRQEQKNDEPTTGSEHTS